MYDNNRTVGVTLILRRDTILKSKYIVILDRKCVDSEHDMKSLTKIIDFTRTEISKQ